MFTAIEAAWNDLAQDSIDRLVDSFINRCQMVLDAGGASITPYLSGHRAPRARFSDPPPSWSPEEDEQLMDLYREHGPKWTRIGTLLGKRPLSVKNRWRRNTQLAVNERHKQHEELPDIATFPGEKVLPDLDEWLKTLG